jgi:CubicO group peptidase (beta-lactamase class C family)
MNHQQQMNTVATKFATFCEATEAARTEFKVPGVAVGILVEGEELTAGFGVTNVNHPLPVDADTLFQIGSTTKTLTATVAMQFVEAGKLELDRPIRDYVPSLELADPEVTAKVTLRHLFTHTGGWIGDFFIDTGRGDDALQRYVTRTKELRQEVPLGEAFVYNNAGLGIASYVIQEVGGKSYEQLVKEMLLDPLGMEMSFFFPEDVMIHRFAVGHSTPAEGEISVAKPWPIPRAANGQGGLSASVRDQLRYARFHMGDGKTAEGKELLSTTMLKKMQEPQVKIPFGGHIGISWFIRHIDELRVVGHGGATLEQHSAFQFAPERDFAFVLTTNSTWGTSCAA